MQPDERLSWFPFSRGFGVSHRESCTPFSVASMPALFTPPDASNIYASEEDLLRASPRPLSLEGKPRVHCEVCWAKSSSSQNRLLRCSGCNLVVHQGCYAVNDVPLPDMKWLCSVCSHWLAQGHTLRPKTDVPDHPCVLTSGDEEPSPPISPLPETKDFTAAKPPAVSRDAFHPVPPPVVCRLCNRPGGPMKLGPEHLWVHVACVHFSDGGPFFRQTPCGLQPNNINKHLAVHRKSNMQCSLCERPSGYTVECSATDCHLRVHVGCASHHDLHPRARIVRAAIATGGEVLFVEKLVKIVTCPEHSAAADVEAILDREQKLFQAEEERRAKSSHDLPLPKKKTSKLKRSSSSPAVSEASILLSRRARGVTKHHGKPSRTISTPHSQVRGVKLIWSKYERYFTRLFQKTPPDLSSTQVRVLEAEGRAVLALLTDQIPCFTGAACPPSYPGFDMSMAFEFLTRGGIRPCLLLGKGVGALCRFQFSPCDQVDEETGLRPQELALMCRKIPRWKDVIQVLQQQFSGRVPGASRTPGSHLVLSDVLPLFFYQAKFLQAALGASRCLNIPLTQFKPVDVAPFKDNDSLTEEAATINHETPFAVVKDDSAYGPARGLPVFGARHRVFAGSLAWDLFPPPVTGPTEVFGDRFEMMRRDNARVLDKENWWRGTLDWVDRSFTFYGSVHREISEELTSLRGKFHESLTRDARQPSDGADHNERCLKRHEAASRWAMTRSNFRMGVSDDRHPLTLLKLSSRDMGTPTRGIMDGLQAAAQGSLHQQICHACMSTEVDSLDPILRCKRCEVLVHKSCYGLHAPMHTDGESWFCKRCAFEKRQARAAALSPGSTTCVVCGLMGGALKQDDCNRWVHSFCAVLLQRAPSLNGECILAC